MSFPSHSPWFGHPNNWQNSQFFLLQFQDEEEEFPQLSVDQIDKLRCEAEKLQEQEAASYNSSK
jgi:hypothetical protein